MKPEFIWFFWFLELLARDQCLFHFLIDFSEIIRRLFVSINRHSAHLIVRNYDLLAVLGEFESSLKLVVIHELLLQSVVVFGAMDWVLLNLLHQCLLGPPVVLVVVGILIIKLLVVLPVPLQRARVVVAWLYLIAHLIIIDIL